MVSFHRYVTVCQRVIVPSIPRARYESCTGSRSNHPTAAMALWVQNPGTLGVFGAANQAAKPCFGSSWIPEFDDWFIYS